MFPATLPDPAPGILIIGYNAFDVVVPLPPEACDFPRRDTKNEVPTIKVGGGGPGATAAVALARLGARVRLVTPLTDDEAGRMQRRELLEAGVDISHCPSLVGRLSAKAVIIVHPDTGERTIFWSRGDLPRLGADLWRSPWLDGMDLLYLDGHEPDLGVRAAQAARSAGLPVVMDAGNVREGSEALVACCTDVISSRRFAPDLVGTEDVRDALEGLRRRGPERVAMTFGQDGVWALDPDPVGVPAFAVRVRDTTGAGDVFHAGYALARCLGGSFRDQLRYGAATAALKCTGLGGRGHLPCHAEVLALLDDGVTRPLPDPYAVR